MTGKNSDTGKTGEAFASEVLKKEGYRIIERNYRCPSGEIDIIAEDGDTIVFIEVKTRKQVVFGLPEEAVDARKQGQISSAALYYTQNKLKGKERASRFDVVSVISGTGGMEAKIIKNAFDVFCR